MIFLFSLIGVCLVAYACLSLFAKKESSMARLFLTSKSARISVAVVGTIMMSSALWLLQVRPGHQYYVVSPFGNKSVYLESGWKVIFPFSIVQEWEKYLDIQTVAEGQSSEGVEGVLRPIDVRFTDQVTGRLNVAMRVELPADPESFITLVETFKHPKNLANNTLTKVLSEQAFNVAQMFRAEAYVTGASQEFRSTLDDALKNGTFVVERREVQDTIYEDINATINVLGRSRPIKEVQTKVEVKKKLSASGLPVREDHDITANNLIIAQVIVEGLEMEEKFRKKLEQQRDISAEKSIEAQKIETSKIAQQRIVAEGERDKAAERVAQEKAQVSKLIAIETQVKEEESKRQLAEIALETEKLLSTKRKVAADAKKYEILQADEISADAKYKLDRQTEQIKMLSQAIEKTAWPTYYVNGGGSSSQSAGSDPLSQMMQLMTMQMADQLKSTKGGK